MPNNWIAKTEEFIKRKNFTCPQGNTMGGLQPANFKEQKERPGDVVICRCKHCGCITRIDWKFIKDWLKQK